jgi:hypothetical protein
MMRERVERSVERQRVGTLTLNAAGCESHRRQRDGGR